MKVDQIYIPHIGKPLASKQSNTIIFILIGFIFGFIIGLVFHYMLNEFKNESEEKGSDLDRSGLLQKQPIKTVA